MTTFRERPTDAANNDDGRLSLAEILEIFASGTLMLEGETKPCLPARLEIKSPQSVRLALTEGRYHQVRRMFAAVGNHVEALHRSRVGGLTLGDLELGKWRPLESADLAKLFAGKH